MPENQLDKMQQRFKEIRKSLKKGQVEFAQLAKIKQSQVSEIENGKRNITSSIILSLEDNLNVNRKWLETGEGEMFLNRSQSSTQINGKVVSELNYPMPSDQRAIELGNGKWAMIVPLVPEYAYAGYAASWKDPEYSESLQKHMAIVDQEPHGEYLAIEVAGESMENWTSEEMAKQSFRDGEIVTGRNIPQHYWKSRFHIHKYKYFIIVHEDGIFVKRITAHDVENGIITCNSLNPNKDLYPDFDLKLSEVSRILNIINPKR